MKVKDCLLFPSAATRAAGGGLLLFVMLSYEPAKDVSYPAVHAAPANTLWNRKESSTVSGEEDKRREPSAPFSVVEEFQQQGNRAAQHYELQEENHDDTDTPTNLPEMKVGRTPVTSHLHKERRGNRALLLKPHHHGRSFTRSSRSPVGYRSGQAVSPGQGRFKLRAVLGAAIAAATVLFISRILDPVRRRPNVTGLLSFFRSEKKMSKVLDRNLFSDNDDDDDDDHEKERGNLGSSSPRTSASGATANGQGVTARGGGKLPPAAFQRSVFATTLLVSILLAVAIAASSATPLRSGGGEQGEQGQHPPVRGGREVEGGGAEGQNDWTPDEAFLIDEVPRQELVKLREQHARLLTGRFFPVADYQRLSDGKLHVVLGRAWRRAADGPWMDGDSYISFRYVGHSFRVYVPAGAEHRLKAAGLLNDLLGALSQPPGEAMFYPDGQSSTADTSSRPPWTSQGEMHWGPERYPPQSMNFFTGVIHAVHLPPAVHALLEKHPAERTELNEVMQLAARVFERISRLGDRFQPDVIRKEAKTEL